MKETLVVVVPQDERIYTGDEGQSVPLLSQCQCGQVDVVPAPLESVQPVDAPQASRLENLESLWKEAEDAQKTMLQVDAQDKRLLKLPWHCRTMAFFAFEKCGLVFEVLFIFFMYYLDVILDIKMCMTFVRYGDVWFMTFSVLGIVLALIFTTMEMNRQLSSLREAGNIAAADGLFAQLLFIGFLIPFQLHMFYICCRSVWDGKPHLFLYTSKLAESVVEATVSGSVQTYATIFRHLDVEDMVVAYASVALSYLSIGLAFTSFDRRETGLASLPGLATGWFSHYGALIAVLVCRICEVTSRVTSLGLFQLAMRFETVFGRFVLGPLIAFDGLAMVVLTVVFQLQQRSGWDALLQALQYSVPSVIGFMNPLLSRGNTHTIPAWAYYSLRLVELLIMGWLVWTFEVWHGKGDKRDHRRADNRYHLEAFKIEFSDDHIALYAFAISTIGWMLLVPIIRTFYADDVMLHDRSIFRSQQFDVIKQRLRDDLLVLRDEAQPLELVRGVTFHRICNSVLKHELTTLRAELGKETALGRMTGKGTTVGRSHSKEWRSMGFLQLRVWQELSKEKEREAGQDHKTDSFLQYLRVWYNIGDFLKRPPESDKLKALQGRSMLVHKDLLAVVEAGKKDLYLRYVENACVALEDANVQGTLRFMSTIQMLLQVIPAWPKKWDPPHDPNQDEKRIFVAKCELVLACMQQGWKFHLESFKPRADELLAKLEVKTIEELRLMEMDEHDVRFVCTTQLITLVQIWQAMPQEHRMGVFREDREIAAMLDAAELLSKRKLAPSSAEMEEQEDSCYKLHIESTEHLAFFEENLDDRLMLYQLKKREANWFQKKDNDSMSSFYSLVREATRLSVVTMADEDDSMPTVLQEKSGAKAYCAKVKAEDGSFKDGERLTVQLQGLVEMGGTDNFWQLKDQMGGDAEKRSVQRTALLLMCNAIKASDLDNTIKHSVEEENLKNASPMNLAGRGISGAIEEGKLRDPDEIAKKRLRVFTDVCEQVRSECTSALKDKHSQLQRYFEKCVHPMTTTEISDVVEYRNLKTTAAIGKIAHLKRKNLTAIAEADTIVDHFNTFLTTVASAFTPFDSTNLWNRDVEEMCKTTHEAVRLERDQLRQEVNQYWNEQETKISTEAKENEAAAKIARKQARAEAQKLAVQKRLAEEMAKRNEQKKKEAEEAQAKAHEEAEQAKKDRQAAIDAEEKAKNEKEAALTLQERAEIREREAKESEAKANAALKEKEAQELKLKRDIEELEGQRRRLEEQKVEAQAAAQQYEREKTAAEASAKEEKQAAQSALKRQKAAEKKEADADRKTEEAKKKLKEAHDLMAEVMEKSEKFRLATSATNATQSQSTEEATKSEEVNGFLDMMTSTLDNIKQKLSLA
eukprot:TRINITY_DN31403_c0_g1_i1.p1 TRINITY_DN31403_c0_g1~~TRINITY_DN31403_c0_g1_i1.p1  ORF type:complete len:1376 (-),score=462.91 TRINITY_DN31403_c0_g1_i1:157-4284(-)